MTTETRQLPRHVHIPPSIDTLLANTSGPRPWLYRGLAQWPLKPGDCYIAVVPICEHDVDLLSVLRSANRRIARLIERRQELTDLYVGVTARLRKAESPVVKVKGPEQ